MEKLYPLVCFILLGAASTLTVGKHPAFQAAGKAADEAVYNLQGIRVADKATVGQLPAGIYISGGKKFIKK